MKNFLFGVFTTLSLGLVSFTTVQEFVTVKPTTPKATVVTTTDYHKVDAFIIKYVNKGYVVHAISNGGSSYACTVVMVKY